MQTVDIIQTVLLIAVGYYAWQWLDLGSKAKDIFGPPTDTSSKTADPIVPSVKPTPQKSVDNAASTTGKTVAEFTDKTHADPPKPAEVHYDTGKLTDKVFNPVNPQRGTYHWVEGKGMVKVE